MTTDIEYLKQLEADLEEVMAREAAGVHHLTAPPPSSRSGRTWAKVAGVAAAFLVVAFTIGSFLGESASDKFQQVGDAVAST
jgi:hypothetical protein